MPTLLTHPVALRCLYVAAMGRAFLRYHNPRRREVGHHQDAFYERAWREAAEEIGATWTRLAPGVGEIERGGAHTRVIGNVSEIDGPVTLAVLHDKPLTNRILRDEGLSVPLFTTFGLSDLSPALRFLASAAPRECVVKPARGTGGGRGVTTGIRRAGELARAAAAAAVYGDELMIEEQIAGDNYRLLYLDGELIDAFVRRHPTVIGDGRSTVAGLVAAANDQRRRARAGISQVLLTVDLDMHRTLARQGLTLRSVPSKGAQVTLKTVINENAGADNTTAMRDLCRSIVDDGTRAVRALRARFVGLDIVTPDPTVPLADAGGAILEANGTPNLYFHYHKQDSAFPVAPLLLARLLSQCPSAADHGQGGDQGWSFADGATCSTPSAILHLPSSSSSSSAGAIER